MRLALAALVLALAGCQAGPAAIAYGKDNCARCRMAIADARYAAELVTRQGKTYAFDSIECLAGFVLQDGVPAGAVRSLWVTDFARPAHLIAAKDAFYLRSSRLRSPMGLGLAAFSTRADRENARVWYPGEALTWDQAVALVRRSGPLEPEQRHPG